VQGVLKIVAETYPRDFHKKVCEKCRLEILGLTPRKAFKDAKVEHLGEGVI
jgi:hypothetical protein